MSESAIREYAQGKGFHRQTLERWLGWAPADREALAEIALGLNVSANHLREIMEWLEEISRRDHSEIHGVLAKQEIFSIKTHPRLGRADKLKRIKEQLRRWRFPRLAGIEDSIRGNIQALKLPAEIRLSVPPGLEGGRLHAEISAGSQAELQELADRLSQAAGTNLAAEIFRRLSGQPVKDEQDQA
ncbi:MAG TPA: hypothetical protein VGB09_01015 [Candidatus Binatia bacterium]